MIIDDVIALWIPSPGTYSTIVVDVYESNTVNDTVPFYLAGYETEVTGSNTTTCRIVSNIETIENENGTAIKYPDGTMICTKTVTWSGVITSAWGSLFDSPLINLGDYAVPFIEKPTISVNTCNTGYSCWIEVIDRVTNTSFGTTYLVRATAISSIQTFKIDCTAIGRWK